MGRYVTEYLQYKSTKRTPNITERLWKIQWIRIRTVFRRSRVTRITEWIPMNDEWLDCTDDRSPFKLNVQWITSLHAPSSTYFQSIPSVVIGRSISDYIAWLQLVLQEEILQSLSLGALMWEFYTFRLHIICWLYANTRNNPSVLFRHGY